jgi:WD40 repeat protein
VQLQVVCKDLWEELGKQNLSLITKQLLSTSGSAELALEKYYNTVVRDVAAGEVAGKLGVGERAIRDWFGSSLISESNTRLQVIKGDLKTGTLPTKVVDELEHAHLVRSDTRRNTWCELTHDRLIRPVTRSNIAWKEAHLSVLQRETELWIIGGSSPDRLLRGTSYRESVRWARRHPAEVTPKEKEYLTRSRRAARRSRLLIAAAVAVLAIIMQAYFTAERAQQQSHLAAVRADAQDAIQVAADQPALAAEYALQAEHRHMEGRSLAGRLFDLATGNETIAAEQETLRGAFLAATVQHDPRYVGLIPYVHRLQDPTCVWFSADGKQIWAYTFVGRRLATPNTPAGRTQAQAFDDDTLEPAANPQAASTGCPTQGFDQPGSVRFSGPAGWSVFKQPDRIEFDAPKGHKPSAYVGSPASTLVAAVVDPTGRRGAWITGRDNYVFVLDFESGQVTSLPAGDLRATSLQFSPDGNILAAGATDYLVRLWWFQAGRTAWEAPEADSPLRAHTDTVVSLGFSPDGRQLASQGLDGQIVVWKTQPVLAPVAGSSPEALVPGVRLAEIDRDNKLIVQAVANEQRVGPVKRFEVGDISDIYLRRDGRSAAIVHGSDRSSWEVVNLETGGSTGPSDRQTQIVNIALSDDGKLAALCTPAGEVNLYSLEGGKLQFEYDLGKAWREFEGKRGHIADHPLGVRSLAFLPDGRTLATGDSFHAIRFWSLEQRGESREKSVPLRNTPTALAITADGSMGASLDEMNMVRFWDLDPASHRILGGSLQLPGSSQAFIVNHDVTIQLPGNPRGIVFGPDSKSFHALFHEGRRLSWKIDMARMREEACKLVEDPQKHAQYCGTAK